MITFIHFNKLRAAHSILPEGNSYLNLNHNQHLNLNVNWNLKWGSAQYSTSEKLLNGNMTREDIDKEFNLFALLKAWVGQGLPNRVQSPALYSVDEVFYLKEYALKVACWFLYLSGWGGDTLRTLMVPDRRHEEQGHPWCHGWHFFTLRKLPRKFCVDIFIRSVSGRGGQEGGYFEDINGFWPYTLRNGMSLMSWRMFFILRMIPAKFHVDIFMGSVSRMGDQEGGYFEDVWGFWQETWMTGSSMTFLMYWVNP